MTSLLVFSHLRWAGAFQRPQQLMSRLAAAHPILFIEEPVVGAERTWLERYSHCAGVQVLRVHVPGNAPGFAEMHMDRMRLLLGQYLEDHGIDQYLLWFCTPMALPLAQDLAPLGSIYDCMDERSALDGAPPALLAREALLLGQVDLVFADGPSLYESQRARHRDVHCFASSVDQAVAATSWDLTAGAMHALLERLEAPAAAAPLPVWALPPQRTPSLPLA